MKNRIDRTLLWFENEDGELTKLGDDFFGFSTLLNRLLNEKYEGRNIQFINIYFATEKKYEKYPINPVNHIHHYGGHLQYYGLIDFEEFNSLNNSQQKHFLWQRSCEYLRACAKKIKNESLLLASEYAYRKGLDMNLNPDYRMVEADLNILDKNFRASVWVNFRQEGMYANFTLEDGDKIVYEKEIDRTKNGIEFFLVMYKSIELNKKYIVIKGRRDVENLPFKIPIEEILI